MKMTRYERQTEVAISSAHRQHMLLIRQTENIEVYDGMTFEDARRLGSEPIGIGHQDCQHTIMFPHRHLFDVAG